jgi:hypothetical protein
MFLLELSEFRQRHVVHFQPAQHLTEVSELVLLALLHLNNRIEMLGGD